MVSKGSKSNKQKTSNSQSWMAYLGIGLVVILVVVVLIGLGQSATPVAQDGRIGPEASIPRGITEDGFHYLGDEDAPVTMRIFEDYACSNCKDFMTSEEQQILDEYVKKGEVRLVIYPMAYVGPQSLPAAEALYCADEQGKFWEYRQLLFVNQGRLVFNRDNFVNIGEVLGLDTGQFLSCYDQALYRGAIIEQTLAAKKFGVAGTPTLEVAGVRYEGNRPFTSTNPEIQGVSEILEDALMSVKE